jgi:hypothetical protein
MFRRSVAALAVLFVAVGLIGAGTYQGAITKLSDTEVTVLVKKDKDDPGTSKTFKISKDTKIATSAGKDAEPKESTLTELTTALKDRGDKGVRARIETEGEGDKETVKKITTFARKK